MPVSGPNLKVAREIGEKAAEDILSILKEKYGISDPLPKEMRIFNFSEQKEQVISNIKSNIIELVVLDFCESF